MGWNNAADLRFCPHIIHDCLSGAGGYGLFAVHEVNIESHSQQ